MATVFIDIPPSHRPCDSIICIYKYNTYLYIIYFIIYFQFDTYVKSLNIEPQAPMFRIVTDGQLPIRQCLHREASIKDIELPEYYNVFHDLRKDFSKFYNAPQDQTFNSITDLVNCILLYNTSIFFFKKCIGIPNIYLYHR